MNKVPGILGQLIKRGLGVDAGVVDEDVDRAELIVGVASQGGQVVPAADVAAVKQARPVTGRYLLRYLFAALGVPPADNDPCAGPPPRPGRSRGCRR
jgi:hypothetical protein